MRKLIRTLLQKVGYDIVKYKPPFVRGKIDKKSLEAENKWIQEYQFQSIIDIGANEGQFSDKIRQLFPNAKIYAFEPLQGAFAKLNANFSKDPKFKSFNVGLSDQKVELMIRENEYSPSSSFLDLAMTHRANFEQAIHTKDLKVQVELLDAIFSDEEIATPLLIKIDVQGFEDKVIRGGINTLQKAAVVICELSFVELYEGQLLFDDIYHQLKQLGFLYSGSIEQLKSPATNRVLQEDGIFIKQ